MTTSLEKLVSERNILKETVYCFTVGATSVFSKQLQALCCFVFDAVDWAAGGHPACKKLSGGMLASGASVWSEGADLHMAQLMPLPLTVSCFSKIQIGLPFWYRFTQVVLDKGPLNGCVLPHS